MTRDELMRRRAETMVAWYLEQGDDRSTCKSDSEIAVALHAIEPTEGWVDTGNPVGNRAVVRRVRRWVDRQRDGEFAGYAFGTRRVGGGAHYSNLTTADSRLASAETGTREQIASAEQQRRLSAETRARQALKLNAEAEEWFQLNDFQRSMVCRDGANEIEQFGYFRPTTMQAFVRLGLSSS
jgi:hypothetical protein